MQHDIELMDRVFDYARESFRTAKRPGGIGRGMGMESRALIQLKEAAHWLREFYRHEQDPSHPMPEEWREGWGPG